MKQKTIIAKFKGQNGSNGFVKDQTYVLKVSHNKGENIKIQTTPDFKGCEYTTFLTFLNNWDKIDGMSR